MTKRLIGWVFVFLCFKNIHNLSQIVCFVWVGFMDSQAVLLIHGVNE